MDLVNRTLQWMLRKYYLIFWGIFALNLHMSIALYFENLDNGTSDDPNPGTSNNPDPGTSHNPDPGTSHNPEPIVTDGFITPVTTPSMVMSSGLRGFVRQPTIMTSRAYLRWAQRVSAHSTFTDPMKLHKRRKLIKNFYPRHIIFSDSDDEEC